ncbi:pectate lyase family protein [Arcticibacter eurypsychrophilus]|uniref:pectate lyase family protein n=1 Tax=Arcticibacter eurypsychrophilus TaxID=1434752 RepID=UPI00084D261F|nr:hypothetical protein [Arcticibacter eurypsychrophilus]
MKFRYILLFTAISLLSFASCKKKQTSGTDISGPIVLPVIIPVVEEALAFPQAEGFGRNTTGGRGGSVIMVTNLNDSGSGSLRAAILTTGPRIIVFKVSGRIILKSTLNINNGDVTIAGQTAPGDGICLSDYTTTINADNVIIRYLRCRLGNEVLVENDAMNGRNHQNIIIDHCSLSWSVDETGSFYDNKNFTLQWCILSESLFAAGHVKGNHGYGGIWGGQKASFHHNLISSHTSRTPRFNGSRYSGQPDLEIVDFRNNVIYNWGNVNSAYGNEGGYVNIVNNYYKAGPATPGNLTTSSVSNKRNRILNYTSFYFGTDAKVYPDTLFGGKFYISGNYINGYSDVTLDNIAKGVQPDSYYRRSSLMASARQVLPADFGVIKTQTAEQAYFSVLDSAGAIFPKRDAVDLRVVNDARTGTASYEGKGYSTVTSPGVTHPSGIIDSQSDVGGWPLYNSTAAPLDSDLDGMPDDWEKVKGLNPNSTSDRNGKNLSTAYDNVEVYINELKN